jgi:hypothetical protein
LLRFKARLSLRNIVRDHACVYEVIERLRPFRRLVHREQIRGDCDDFDYTHIVSLSGAAYSQALAPEQFSHGERSDESSTQSTGVAAGRIP